MPVDRLFARDGSGSGHLHPRYGIGGIDFSKDIGHLSAARPKTMCQAAERGGSRKVQRARPDAESGRLSSRVHDGWMRSPTHANPNTSRSVYNAMPYTDADCASAMGGEENCLVWHISTGPQSSRQLGDPRA